VVRVVENAFAIRGKVRNINVAVFILLYSMISRSGRDEANLATRKTDVS
jgi:hypothetical protein